jgi:hypothetical protein
MNANEAIAHLSLLAIYADDKIGEAEDQRIDGILTRLGWESESGERGRFLANAFAKIRLVSESDEARVAFLTEEIRPALQSETDRAYAVDTLNSVLSADGIVGEQEKHLLSLVEWVLR